jgi:hypothetical protein
MSTRNFKILCDLAFWSNYIGKNDKILEPKDMIKREGSGERWLYDDIKKMCQITPLTSTL